MSFMTGVMTPTLFCVPALGINTGGFICAAGSQSGNGVGVISQEKSDTVSSGPRTRCNCGAKGLHQNKGGNKSYCFPSLAADLETTFC
ncbi:hypothetical protein FKM82_002672 [Ascaphus truei]